MSDSSNILAVGTAAVVSYYGSRLLQAEARVSVVCRSDYYAVKKIVITMKSVSGELLFKHADPRLRTGGEQIQSAVSTGQFAPLIKMLLKVFAV